jgi:cation transport regulator ChaB
MGREFEIEDEIEYQEEEDREKEIQEVLDVHSAIIFFTPALQAAFQDYRITLANRH